MVQDAVKRCWCSCFSERVMSHRLECGMPITGLKMAIVVQVGGALSLSHLATIYMLTGSIIDLSKLLCSCRLLPADKVNVVMM